MGKVRMGVRENKQFLVLPLGKGGSISVVAFSLSIIEVL
jgi:hypothetical protein